MTSAALICRVVSDRRGGHTVEFAMLALPFIQVVLSIIEFMFMMSGWSTVQYAAAAGARYAIANPGSTTQVVAQQAQAFASSMGLTQSQGLTMSAAAGTTTGTNSASNTMTVTGTYSYTFHVAFWPMPGITMVSKSVAVIS